MTVTVQSWFVAALAVLGAFFVAGIAGSVVVEYLGLWHLPGAGFCAAFAVVVVTYIAAPARKLSSAVMSLLIGAGVAWSLLEPSYYPAHHGEGVAYTRTHAPVIATYAGGMLGALCVWLIEHRRDGDC